MCGVRKKAADKKSADGELTLESNRPKFKSRLCNWDKVVHISVTFFICKMAIKSPTSPVVVWMKGDLWYGLLTWGITMILLYS